MSCEIKKASNLTQTATTSLPLSRSHVPQHGARIAGMDLLMSYELLGEYHGFTLVNQVWRETTYDINRKTPNFHEIQKLPHQY